MKKQALLKLFCTLLIVVIFIVSLSSCGLVKIDYYSNKENYIVVTGEVSRIRFDESSSRVYLNFSKLNTTLSASSFQIAGKNALIVMERGILDRIKKGDTIEFITAPRYFGNGYFMPIVSITVGDEELLSFEEGYENYLEWLKQDIPSMIC